VTWCDLFSGLIYLIKYDFKNEKTYSWANPCLDLQKQKWLGVGHCRQKISRMTRFRFTLEATCTKPDRSCVVHSSDDQYHTVNYWAVYCWSANCSWSTNLQKHFESNQNHCCRLCVSSVVYLRGIEGLAPSYLSELCCSTTQVASSAPLRNLLFPAQGLPLGSAVPFLLLALRPGMGFLSLFA